MRNLVSATVAGLVLGPFLGACTSTQRDDTPVDHGLTGAERAAAVAAARTEIERQEATVTSATVTIGRGPVAQSNTGFTCESDVVLKVKLIGDFPHVVTTGHALGPRNHGEDVDFIVRAMLLKVDPDSGQTCLIGVQTGKVRPDPGAIDLDLG